MQSWQLFELFSSRGKEKLAARLGRSLSLIQKWGREPLSDDEPTATGAANPIDSLEAAFEVAQFECPEFQVALIEYFLDKLEDGNRARALKGQDLRSRLHAVEKGSRKRAS